VVPVGGVSGFFIGHSTIRSPAVPYRIIKPDQRMLP
jgi:hypothetical protein